MRQWIALVILVSMLIGCAGMHIQDLKPGMTKQEVVEMLGKPDGYLVSGKAETYLYTNLYVGGSASNYSLLFWDDKLNSWEPTYIHYPQGFVGVGVSLPPPGDRY